MAVGSYGPNTQGGFPAIFCSPLLKGHFLGFETLLTLVSTLLTLVSTACFRAFILSSYLILPDARPTLLGPFAPLKNPLHFSKALLILSEAILTPSVLKANI